MKEKKRTRAQSPGGSGQTKQSRNIGKIPATKQTLPTFTIGKALWHSIIDACPDHVVVLDTALNIQYANSAAPGLTMDEIIGTPMYSHVEEGKQQEIKNLLEEVLETGKSARYETQYHIPEDGILYYESHTVHIIGDNAIGLIVYARDISDRKQAEIEQQNLIKLLEEKTEAIGESYQNLQETRDGLERAHDTIMLRTVQLETTNDEYKITQVQLFESNAKLRESENQYRDLFESALDMIHIVDGEGKIIKVNRVEQEKLGYSQEEMIGKYLLDMIHPDYQEITAVAFKRVRTGNSIESCETALITKAGEKIFVDANIVPCVENGQVVSVRAIIRDITERKQAEKIIQQKILVEEAIARISYDFSCSIDIDQAINAALCDIGELTGADRAYLFQLDDSGISISNTHEWCQENVTPQIESLQNVPCTMFPWWIEKMQMGEAINITDVSQMPSEATAEKELVKSQDIESFILLPVYSGSRWAGFLGLDNISEVSEWSEESVILLRTVDGIIGIGLERKKAEDQLNQELVTRGELMDNLPCIAMIVKKGTREIIASNNIAKSIGAFPGKTCYQTCAERDDPCPFCRAPELWNSGQAQQLEVEYRDKYYECRWVPLSEDMYVHYIFDITERKRIEEESLLFNSILKIMNTHIQTNPMLDDIVKVIQDNYGFNAVGIRLLDEEGNIPYEAYMGFSQEFYESESPLSIKNDQCMCINVIKGTTDPQLQFYTSGGSFYMNGTTAFLATVSEEDKGSTRNVCNMYGYESVALVPLYMDSRIVGLIHVADPRENIVPLETVQQLERLASQLGPNIERTRAEEALLESEAQNRSVIENLPLGIHMYELKPDGQLYFTGSNPAADEILGIDNCQYIDRAIDDAFPRIAETDIAEKFREIAEKGGVWHKEDIIYEDEHISGVFENFNFQIAPGRMVSMFTEITERKQAEEAVQQSEYRLRLIADALPVLISYVDKEERYQFNNKGYENWFGHSREEMHGQKIADIMGVEAYESVKEYLDCALSGQAVHYESKVPYKDAGLRDIEANYIPHIGIDGQVKGFYALIQDITERKKAEDALMI
ncbi:MAG: PAS domain S-box protein [Chloroflexi bacterium]|nr:PAS domain S-box protein [Chloroflexota bacterium]